MKTQDIVREDECVYLFLPLAHALALVIQFLVLDVGTTIAYWKKDPQKIVANLIELKPTFFPSVTRIFEKIHTLATSGGDPRELERATRVGMAVRQRSFAARRSPPSCRRRSSAPSRRCMSTCATCSAGARARR